MAWHKAETDLAKPVIAFLEGLKWDVYQEVECGAGIADIIAVQGRIVWVVELKRSLSMEVVAQAKRWIPYAHRVSVAVPRCYRYSNGRHLTEEVLRMFRIGHLAVNGTMSGDPVVTTRHAAPLHRYAKAERIRKILAPEHKTFATAGSANGGRWTPFVRTCQAIVAAVKLDPGISLKSLVNSIDHHYATDASARGSLSHWIRSGVVDGVEARKDGRHLCVYPVAESKVS